jgi:class 3 adenylate cyclase
MDVGDWLRGLGLGRYETVFRDNEIDVEVLRELTESDLEKLGVPLGHRKRLLKAIADAGATAIAPPTVTARPDAQAAERRQLTVMFIDLVGSTALSAKLDPEDLRSIFGAYQRCCAELVQRNGGFVAKYMGDGVLAYFGYPQAHEDDAERAVEAGLALVEAVPKLNTVAGVPLSARVGIATGLVVVGDLIGTGAARERAVVGETPNLAARLQAIAEPNTVVIADGTRRLIGNLFELEDLGSKELRGIADPARSWRVLRTSAMESRFEALHAGGLTALVGREDESELLRRCWSRSESGEGQVVLLSGEPGIGKSRRCSNAWPMSRTRACAISARRSTPTAPFIPSSARWSAPPDLPTTIRRRRSSTSSMRCWRRPRPQLRTPRCLPTCCRCLTTAAIRRCRSFRNSAGKRRYRRSSGK